MNRYTQRGVRALYNPVSFEQFAQAPLMAQQLHDQTIASAVAQQEYLNSLPWHEKEARKVEGELESQIESLTNKITNSDRGIYDVDGVKELTNIKNYKRNKFTPVKNKIESALVARENFKKNIQERVVKGDFSHNDVATMMNMFDTSSQQAMVDGNISYNTTDYSSIVGYGDKLREIAKDVPEREFVNNTGYRINQNDSSFTNIKTGVTYRFGDPSNKEEQAKMIENFTNYLTSQATSDSDVSGSLQTEYALYGDKSKGFNQFVSERLTPIAEQISSIYGGRLKTDQSISRQSMNEFERGVYLPPSLNDMYYGYAGNFKFGEDATVVTPFKSQKKLVDSQGNALDKITIQKELSKALKNQGYEQFLDENGVVTEQFLMRYLKAETGSLGQRAVEDFKNAVDIFSTDISDAFKLLNSKTPGNLVSKLLDPKNFESMGLALEDVTSTLREKGFKTEKFTKEEQKAFNEQLTTDYHNYIQDFQNQLSERPDVLKGFKFDGGAEENIIKYRSAVSNKKERPMKGYSSNNSKNPFYITEPIVNTAIKNNNFAVLVEAGNIMVLDENGTKLEVGSDIYKALRNESTDIIPGVQITENTIPEFIGGYTLGVKTQDGKIYRVLVPPTADKVKSVFSPFAEFARLSRTPTNMQAITSDAPIFPIYNSQGMLVDKVRLKKYDGVSKKGEYAQYFQAIDKDGNVIENENGPSIFSYEEVISELRNLLRS